MKVLFAVTLTLLGLVGFACTETETTSPAIAQDASAGAGMGRVDYWQIVHQGREHGRVMFGSTVRVVLFNDNWTCSEQEPPEELTDDTRWVKYVCNLSVDAEASEND